MSYKYEKVSDNILKYTTKSGVDKFRVVITINNVAIDKSGLKNITEAKNFIKAKTAEILNGEYEKGKSKEYTFDEYWEYYLKQKTTPKGIDGKPNWNRTSAYSITCQFEKHILPYFEGKIISEVTRMEFETFAAYLIGEKKLRTRSVEFNMRVLSNMLNDAVQNEAVDRNRTHGITIPTSKIEPYNKELTPSQYNQMVEYFEWQHISEKVRFYLLSLGLRRSEVVGLKVSSIEFIDTYTKLTIDTSRPPAYPEGKSTKTNKPRVVYASPKITLVLKEYMKWMQTVYKSENKLIHKDNWLLIGIHSTKPLTAQTLANTIMRCGDSLGFKVTPHSLRHYFATQAKLDGVDVRLIADTLGHQSLATTEGYTHGEEESARKIVDMVRFL